MALSPQTAEPIALDLNCMRESTLITYSSLNALPRAHTSRLARADMVGTISKVDLHHCLPRVLLPPTTAKARPNPPHSGQALGLQTPTPGTSTTAPPAPPAPPAPLAPPAPPPAHHDPTPIMMQLYGFVFQPALPPSAQHIGPLGIPVYDIDLTSVSAGAHVANMLGASTGECNAAPLPSSSLQPPSPPCLRAPMGSFQPALPESCGSPWLHPFGILLHSPLPSCALPPFR